MPSVPFNVELRCTHLRFEKALELARTARSFFLMTYRRRLSEGKLKQLLQYAKFVDVGMSDRTGRSAYRGLGLKGRVFTSAHLSKLPSSKRFQQLNDVTKLAVSVRSASALLDLLMFAHRAPIVIGSGYHGRPTRILYKRINRGVKVGSPTICLPSGKLRLMPPSSESRRATFANRLQFTYSVPKYSVCERTRRLGMYSYEVLKYLYRADSIGPTTVLLAVAGWPINHSLGPLVFNTFASQCGLDSVYFRLATTDAAGLLSIAQKLGVKGMSITAPLKAEIASLASTCDNYVKSTGVANTLIFSSTSIQAYNTDCAAYEQILNSMKDVYGNTAPVLVLGSGATAISACYASCRAGFETFVCARSDKAASSLAGRLRIKHVAVGSLKTASKSMSIIVNTTPYYGNNELAESVVFGARSTLIESVYYPLITPLVDKARVFQSSVVLGTVLYLRQAAYQARLFFGAEHVRKFDRIASRIIRYYRRQRWLKRGSLGQADLEEVLFTKSLLRSP